METKFKNFKHFNKFKYPYKNYKYQANKSKDNVRETVKDTAMVKVSDKLADPSKAGVDNSTWQEDFQKLKTNLISMIELKTKYYIDQRMGILINGNSLYTRGYCSLNILDDFSHGGKSLVYKNNGNPVVTMTQDGYIYCKNIFLNGLNVYEMFQRIFNDFSEGGSIYVKHIDLKNGLYDMDINKAILKHLAFTNNDNSEYVYLNYDDNNNNLAINFNNDAARYLLYNDKCQFLVPFYSDNKDTNPIVCINNDNAVWTTCAAFFAPNTTSGNGCEIKIGKADSKGNMSYLHYIWQGNNNANNGLCIGFHSYDNLYQFYRDRVEFFGKLRMRANVIVPIEILSNKNTPTIYLGYDSSTNNCMTIRYKHNTNPHSLGIGFYGNDDILTIDTDKNVNINEGMLDIISSTAHKIYQKLECTQTLSNSEYIRLQFNDTAKEAMIDFVKTSEGYKLMLYIFMSLSGITITESSVDLMGQVNVNSDLNIDYGRLYVGNIYANSQGYIEINNSLRLFSDFWLENKSISQICTSTDYANNQKISNNALITSQAVKDALDNTNTSIHQEIPNNPYESVPITDNPYLKWSINSIGNYDTNTNAVCYSEELHQFVIVGNNGYTYFSYDGFTWMSNSMNTFTWTGVTYGPTYGYITCTSSNMYLLSSTDGRTWVPHNNVSPTTGRAITYGNNYYAIVPDGTYASYLSYTTNPTIATGWGSYWLGSSGKWYNIAYSKFQHKFLIVGASGKYVSCDDNFTSSSRVTGQLTGVTDDCHGVCYSEKLNLWIIACNDSSYCYISQDGNTFTQATLPYQTSWHRVIWGNDRFIMTSSGSSSAAYSLDGTNWYPFDVSTIGAYSSWLGLAYGNGLFILSGNNNSVPLNALVATYTLPNSYITPRAMMQQIYPIGSIYISMININPGVIFGGSWTEIQNRFLYAVPTTSTSGTTGGEASHKLTVAEMPAHGHTFNGGFSWNWGDSGATESYRNAGNMSSGGPGGWNCLTTRRWGGVNNTGSTQAHNNMPPYITCYAWYRYA